MIIKPNGNIKPVILKNLNTGLWRNEVELPDTIGRWDNLKDVYDLMVVDSNRRSRGLKIYRGLVLNERTNNIVVVVCDIEGELRAYINEEFLAANPTHLDYIKHGIYKLGVKRGKYVLKSEIELFMMFFSNLKLTLQELLPEGQLQNSKAFLEYKRSKLVEPKVEVPPTLDKSTATAIPSKPPKSSRPAPTQTWDEFFTVLEDNPPAPRAARTSAEIAQYIETLTSTLTSSLSTTASSAAPMNVDDELLERLDQELRSLYGS